MLSFKIVKFKQIRQRRALSFQRRFRSAMAISAAFQPGDPITPPPKETNAQKNWSRSGKGNRKLFVWLLDIAM